MSCPEREAVIEGWIKMLNAGLHNSYTSANDVRVNQSRRMRWCMSHVREVSKMRT
jgi:hypothetical protein